MHQYPSPALVRSAVAGDEAALLRLLESARPDIRRYARAACRAADIDDAVQESLLLLYRRVGSLRAASAFPAWLFSVVRRTCLRLARSFGALPGGLPAEREVLARTDETLRLDLAAAIQSCRRTTAWSWSCATSRNARWTRWPPRSGSAGKR